MNGLFKNILCPVELEEASLAAIEVARGALQPGGHLRFLHLKEFPFALTQQEARFPLSLTKEKLEAILLARLGREVSYEVTVLSTDNVPKSIVAAARDFDADCIVLATHARRGMDKVLLGSTAERVIRQSPCPVLTIARPAPPEKKSAD